MYRWIRVLKSAQSAARTRFRSGILFPNPKRGATVIPMTIFALSAMAKTVCFSSVCAVPLRSVQAYHVFMLPALMTIRSFWRLATMCRMLRIEPVSSTRVHGVRLSVSPCNTLWMTAEKDFLSASLGRH